MSQILDLKANKHLKHKQINQTNNQWNESLLFTCFQYLPSFLEVTTILHFTCISPVLKRAKQTARNE